MKLARIGPAVVHRIVFEDGHDDGYGYYSPPLIGGRFGSSIAMASFDAVAKHLAATGEKYVFRAENKHDSCKKSQLVPRTYVSPTHDERVAFEAVYAANKV